MHLYLKLIVYELSIQPVLLLGKLSSCYQVTMNCCHKIDLVGLEIKYLLMHSLIS